MPDKFIQNPTCRKLIRNIRDINYVSVLNVSKINVLYAVLGGILGALGFLYNSGDVVLGSMLVSPLTSPLLRSITGIITNEHKYTINGIISVILLSILIVFIGVIMGYVNEHFDFFETPTEEMKRRISIEHMVVAFIIALIAGITIGISTYRKDYIVMAGISLTISILPPLINAGLYYGDFLYHPEKDKNMLYHDFLRSLFLAFVNMVGVMVTAYFSLKHMC
jgi:uncharacterized hydrophobic protein (TIGR00271 family)